MCCSCTLWVTCPLTIVMGLNPCTIIVIACRVWVSPWPCLDSSLGFSSRRFSKYFCVLIGHPSGQDGRDWPLSVILRKKKHCVERTLSMMESHKAAEDNQNKGNINDSRGSPLISYKRDCLRFPQELTLNWICIPSQAEIADVKQKKRIGFILRVSKYSMNRIYASFLDFTFILRCRFTWNIAMRSFFNRNLSISCFCIIVASSSGP